MVWRCGKDRRKFTKEDITLVICKDKEGDENKVAYTNRLVDDHVLRVGDRVDQHLWTSKMNCCKAG